MEEKKITYNGMQLSESWVQEIEEAQKIPTININGQEYKRVAYGNEKEDWGASGGPCHDCAVIPDQFHVPNCSIERCPACDGQAIGCNCDYEGDDTA